MSAIPLSHLQLPSTPVIRPLERLPPNLPDDDGEPLESNRHRLAMETLIESVEPVLKRLRQHTDFFAGGNMFIYYLDPQTRQPKFVGPDFFVVLNIDGSYPRRSWKVPNEGGHYPDVIVELLSETTTITDLTTKKTLYEQVFKTKEYFVFDPYDADSLQGWRLKKTRYHPIRPNSNRWLWSEQLGFWLGTWEGSVDTMAREVGTWLRFYDPEGQLAWLPAEYEKQQRQLAQRQARRAQQKAKQEVLQAQQETLQAQQETLQAQQETLQARQRAEQLAERLRALGINPEEV